MNAKPESIYDTVYAQLREEQDHRSNTLAKFKILLFIFILGMAIGISLISVSKTHEGLRYSLILIFGFITIVVALAFKYIVEIYTSLTREHMHMNRIATIKNSYIESIHSRHENEIFEFKIDVNKTEKENQEELLKQYNEFLKTK